VIIERLVFRAKFGQGDSVVAAFTEWRDRHAARLGVPVRVLVDVTGAMFTVVAENEYRDLAHVAQVQTALEQEFQSSEFQQWFSKWSALTETGSRELYRVVE
jgi:glucose uptake protein GlcU